MLTLMDINRALDRLGIEAFIPRTRWKLAGSLRSSGGRRTRAPTFPRWHRPESTWRDPYDVRQRTADDMCPGSRGDHGSTGVRFVVICETLDFEPE